MDIPAIGLHLKPVNNLCYFGNCLSHNGAMKRMSRYAVEKSPPPYIRSGIFRGGPPLRLASLFEKFSKTDQQMDKLAFNASELQYL